MTLDVKLGSHINCRNDGGVQFLETPNLALLPQYIVNNFCTSLPQLLS
jgi:hypothetical protein